MAPNSILNVINLLSLVPSWRTSSLAWDKLNEKQVDFFPFTMGNHSHNEYCLWHYKHISLKHICVTVMTSNCYIKGSQLNATLSFTNNDFDFCSDAVRSESFASKKDINFCFSIHKTSIAWSQQLSVWQLTVPQPQQVLWDNGTRSGCRQVIWMGRSWTRSCDFIVYYIPFSKLVPTM